MKLKQINPLGDRILVRPDKAAEKSKGGLMIPDAAKEKPSSGTAVKVGPGLHNEGLPIKEGDGLLYSKYAGADIPIEGETYLIIRYTDILAVIKNES